MNDMGPDAEVTGVRLVLGNCMASELWTLDIRAGPSADIEELAALGFPEFGLAVGPDPGYENPLIGLDKACS
jgi:hypothetical protein